MIEKGILSKDETYKLLHVITQKQILNALWSRRYYTQQHLTLSFQNSQVHTQLYNGVDPMQVKDPILALGLYSALNSQLTCPTV